jgi:hypothetical protein
MWASNNLGAFNFRVTFMDQKQLTTGLEKNADGICTGLTVLWLQRILANPNEDAWSRLHWAKKQKTTAAGIQQQRESITSDYDKKFGDERVAQYDQLMEKHDPQSKIAQAKSELKKLPKNAVAAMQQGMKVTEWMERTQFWKRQYESALSTAQKSAGKEIDLLMESLDNHATATQIGELLALHGLKPVDATKRCPVEEDHQISTFVHELDRLERPAGLLFSITFTNIRQEKPRHMLGAFWTGQYLRMLDPNAGEYYCPRSDIKILIQNLQSRYAQEQCEINDMQAFQIEQT